jgi:hypothetical protein
MLLVSVRVGCIDHVFVEIETKKKLNFLTN